MNLKIDFKQKPLEFSSSILLMIIGALTGFIGPDWIIPIGAISSALGGALFAYACSDINLREKAAGHLAPELNAMARHLADTAAKLSRTIQDYLQEHVSADLTIDRISQLVSSLYTSLNDVHIISGTITNFQPLVDTVQACEETTSKLEKIFHKEGRPSQEVQELRTLVDEIKKRLEITQKTFGDFTTSRKEEKVNCPYCGNENTVFLGSVRGDTGLGICSSCSQRFNVHRGVDGNPFTKSLGPSTTIIPFFNIIKVNCPKCKTDFKIKFDKDKTQIDRFCLNCGSLLTIVPSGQVEKYSEGKIMKAEITGFSGNRQNIKCPTCAREYTSLWHNGTIARAACTNCITVLEVPDRKREGSPIDYS